MHEYSEYVMTRLVCARGSLMRGRNNNECSRLEKKHPKMRSTWLKSGTRSTANTCATKHCHHQQLNSTLPWLCRHSHYSKFTSPPSLLIIPRYPLIILCMLHMGGDVTSLWICLPHPCIPPAGCHLLLVAMTRLALLLFRPEKSHHLLQTWIILWNKVP